MEINTFVRCWKNECFSKTCETCLLSFNQRNRISYQVLWKAPKKLKQEHKWISTVVGVTTVSFFTNSPRSGQIKLCCRNSTGHNRSLIHDEPHINLTHAFNSDLKFKTCYVPLSCNKSTARFKFWKQIVNFQHETHDFLILIAIPTRIALAFSQIVNWIL